MQPDEVARKYQHRAGFRLADYAEVGLPIYAVTLCGLTLTRKRIPPLEEFVLKCVDRGLSTNAEIAAFLGLEEHIVKGVLINLAQAESIALLADTGSRSQALHLTHKGKRTLQTAEMQEPEARVFVIHYDAVLRRARWYGRLPGLKYETLKERGMFEIQAYPAKRPRISDMDVSETGKIIRGLGNPDQYKRDLIAVKSIEKIQKFYLPAVGLVYVSNTGDDVQVAFAIDGILSRDHEIAYAQMGGPKRQGIEKGIRDPVRGNDAAGIKDELGIDNEKLRELAASASTAQLAVLQVQDELQGTEDEGQKKALEEKLKEAQEERLRAERELSESPVVDLSTYDHPPLLEDAMTRSQQRLLIISPWIRAEVVNKDFLAKLEGLLKRNVNAYIGYGISAHPTEDADTEDQDAKDKLEQLAKRHPNLHFKRLGNTHAKVLIKDRDFAVVTSFNWLSFRGVQGLPFRDEQGVKIQHPDLVDGKFQQQSQRF